MPTCTHPPSRQCTLVQLPPDILNMILSYLCPKNNDPTESLSTVVDVAIDTSEFLDARLVCRAFYECTTPLVDELYESYIRCLRPITPFSYRFVQDVLDIHHTRYQGMSFFQTVHSKLAEMSTIVQDYIRHLPTYGPQSPFRPLEYLLMYAPVHHYIHDHNAWITFVHKHYDFPMMPLTQTNLYDFEDNQSEPWAFFVLWDANPCALAKSAEEALEMLHTNAMDARTM